MESVAERVKSANWRSVERGEENCNWMVWLERRVRLEVRGEFQVGS